MKSFLTVRRYPYDDPHLLHIEIAASNGDFQGGTDFYCGASDLVELGEGLNVFPRTVKDEYKFEMGSKSPDYYNYFLLRAYTVDSVGHCALQIEVQRNTSEPHEGSCKFSIKVDAGTINRLGNLFTQFAELKHSEMRWSPSLEDTQLFERLQP